VFWNATSTSTWVRRSELDLGITRVEKRVDRLFGRLRVLGGGIVSISPSVRRGVIGPGRTCRNPSRPGESSGSSSKADTAGLAITLLLMGKRRGVGGKL